jgi:deoxyribodipyrimidine photolyase-related protein
MVVEMKDCWFPVSHIESMKWLHKFIKERLDNFGTYQDAIRKDEGFEYRSLFHSLIAPMLNIGLISPNQIIEEVMKVKGKYGMNNIEGFLRQIIGWREYQRYCYLHYYDQMTKANVFKNNRKLTSAWYNGTTGIIPVDDAIKDAFKYGYLHHIQRLMIMSNIFNLVDLDPHEAYKWFMEFSVDSYDWLMTQNVYSMGMWADGGLTMRKPYISTAAYVIGMSNYKKPTKKEGSDWTEIWRALFYHKITSNREIFQKTPYIFQLKAWDKMEKSKKDELIELRKSFLTKL